MLQHFLPFEHIDQSIKMHALQRFYESNVQGCVESSRVFRVEY